jgi:hypothetical protein
MCDKMITFLFTPKISCEIVQALEFPFRYYRHRDILQNSERKDKMFLGVFFSLSCALPMLISQYRAIAIEICQEYRNM